jgi:hypothetical protein
MLQVALSLLLIELKDAKLCHYLYFNKNSLLNASLRDVKRNFGVPEEVRVGRVRRVVEDVGDLSRQQLTNFFTLYANILAIASLVSRVAAKNKSKRKASSAVRKWYSRKS